jgi:hypothetical protein
MTGMCSSVQGAAAKPPTGVSDCETPLPVAVSAFGGSGAPAVDLRRTDGNPRSRGFNRRPAGYMTAVLVALIAMLAVPAIASAAPKSIGGFIGGPFGVGAGQFNQPRDVAVFEGTDGDTATDKIFVVEAQSANHRVQRLDVDGNFELMWGRNVDATNPGTGFEVCLNAASCQAPSSGATGTAKGEFNRPSGVAVDQQDGWVYVYDRDNTRIQKFDLDGNFILMFGKGVNVTTGGDVCTQASGNVCGPGSSGTAAGQLMTTSQEVRGLAVHSATGAVFVADPQSRRILQYQPDGGFVRGWGFGVDTGASEFQVCTTASACQAGNAAGLANGQFSSNSPLGLAIDSQGVVHATDSASGTSQNRIVRFDSDLAPTEPGPPFPDASAALLGLINPTGAGGPLLATTTTMTGIEIDGDSDGAGPDEESLLVVRRPNTPSMANTVVQELDIPTEAGELPADPVALANTHTFAPLSIHNNGIGVNSGTGNIYLAISVGAAEFPSCGCATGSTQVFGLAVLTEDSPPIGASVEPPADATSTSVELVGTVDPGFFVAYRFQISTDGASWSDIGPQSYVGGSQPVEVSQLATGLDPSTLYRVRMVLRRVTSLTVAETVVTNEGLVLTDGAAPEVQTLGSADRTETSVQLRATVDPNGAPTSYRFEYGPAGGSFDSHLPVPNASAGSANTAGLVTQQLAGLLAGTAYHYRVVATNPSGTTTGSPAAFSTEPAAGNRPSLGDRVYELVSPADKVGGAGVGQWGGGAAGAASSSGDAAHIGDRFIVRATLGSVLLDGATSYASDAAHAQRTANGWVSHAPVTHAASNKQEFRFLLAESASEDLSKVTWTSNGDLLRVFPELANWPGSMNADFIADWQGRWELLAPTSLDQLHSLSFGAAADGQLTRSVVSRNGSHVAFTTGLPSIGGVQKSNPGGMAGIGDPAHPQWNDLVLGRAVYVDDISTGPSDALVGNGVYSNAGVCADGTVLPNVATPGGKLNSRPCPAPLPGRAARLISDRGAAMHSGPAGGNSVENAISRDGSRTFFLSPDPVAAGVPASGCTNTGDSTLCAPQLYVRQRNANGTVTTRWISRVEVALFGNQDAALTGNLRFAGASIDGDKVFFQTTSPLTTDDPNATGGAAPVGGITTGSASSSSWDLYMYDLPNGPDGNPSTADADPAGGTLTRISAGPTGAGDCNVVVSNSAHGSLRFAADDGSRVYFTCAAPLPGTPLSGNGTITTASGTTATTDASNLYVYDDMLGTDAWRFVARLPKSTGSNDVFKSCVTTDSSGTKGLLSTANRSTDLTFNQSGWNCVRGTADGEFITFWTSGKLTLDDPDEVTIDGYAYDAVTEELTRITAPQGGAGGSYLCNPYTGSGASSPMQCYGDNGFGGEPIALLGVATRPQVDGDRIAFFQSRSRLVAGDVDDAYDVYQWRNGELSLVSGGHSALSGAPGELGGSFYKGNSADGRNVYFATNDKLSWQDVDAVLDIYTARVGNGIPQPPPPVVCEVLVGGCHGGGAGTLSVPTSTLAPGASGNAGRRARATLAVAGVGARARRRAARSGVLTLRVRASSAGTVSVLARGRVGGRTRVLGRASRGVVGPGVVGIEVRLSRVARRALRTGRTLRLAVGVRQAGARSRSITVGLVRGARS